MDITALDALLLFLVSHKGQSGYDIRQLMQSTPLRLFSDSPGAIYPALARLEMKGLLTSSAEPDGRRKRVYDRTEAGGKALGDWLAQPVDLGAVMRRQQELDLRFVLLAEMFGRRRALAFSRDCAALEAIHLAEVEAFLDGPGQAMSRAALQSLELGARLIRARMQWRCDLMSDEGDDDDEAGTLARD